MALNFLQYEADWGAHLVTTFTSQNLGSPAPDRQIVLLVQWGAADPQGTLEYISIGGVRAEILATEFTNAADEDIHEGFALARLRVPEGTAADIEVSLDYSSRWDIYGVTYSAYRAVNLSAEPRSVDVVTNAGGDPLETTLTIPDGGSAAGLCMSSIITSAQSITWSGMLEDFEDFGAVVAASASTRLSGASLTLPNAATSTGYSSVPVSASITSSATIVVGFFIVFSLRVNQFLPLTPTMDKSTLVSLINSNFGRTGKNYTPLTGQDIGQLAPIINANFAKAGIGMLPVVATASLDQQLAAINLNFNRLTL